MARKPSESSTSRKPLPTAKARTKGPRTVTHDHQPIYRVARREWQNPLDAAHSRRQPGRWNTADFPALYCCCSVEVARAVVRDVFRLAGVTLADLQEGRKPMLVPVRWQGEAVDVASAEGVAAAGLPPNYPNGASHDATRPLAAAWHDGGAEAVLCRSASLARDGFDTWMDPHEAWGEVAIFVANAATKPKAGRVRRDLRWLEAPITKTGA
jgi:RES domain-containing protein